MKTVCYVALFVIRKYYKERQIDVVFQTEDQAKSIYDVNNNEFEKHKLFFNEILTHRHWCWY